MKRTRKIKSNVDTICSQGISKLGISGDGIGDWLKKGYNKVRNLFDVSLGPSQTLSPNVRNILKDYGNIPVAKIYIARKPLNGGIEKFLNVISLGGLNKAKQEIGIDQIYHLYLLFELQTGVWIKLEKNESVQMSRSEPPPVDSRHVLPFVRTNLNEFVDKARKAVGDKNFFLYSAGSNNCQKFVYDCLAANGDLHQGDEAYILQDAQALLQKSPFAKRFIDATTLVGSIGTRAIGNGVASRRPKRRT